MDPKIIVVDIDGVLLNNAFLEIFKNIRARIEKRTFLKKSFLRLAETIERFIRVRHTSNQKLIRFLNNLKTKTNISIFILTDRSLKGLQNIFFEAISPLDLDYRDYIQIRGQQKEGISKIRMKAKIFISTSMKPSKLVLFPLLSIIKKRGIRPEEVLIIDDDIYFLQIAESFGLKNISPIIRLLK